MSAVSLIALSLVGIWLFWMFGSWLLRWGGGILIALSLASITSGETLGILWVTVPAFLLWVLGHWLYVLRHGYYRSDLVARLFGHEATDREGELRWREQLLNRLP